MDVEIFLMFIVAENTESVNIYKWMFYPESGATFI